MILPMTPGLFPVPQVTGGYQTLGTAWNGLAGLLGLGDATGYVSYGDDSGGDYYSGDTVSTLPPVSNGSGSSSIWDPFSSLTASNASTPISTIAGVSSSSPGINSNTINAIALGLENTASSVLKAQFGQPNLAPGEYVNTATGVAYRQPAGVAINGSSATLTGSLGSLMPILLLGGAAVLIFSLVGKK